MQKSIALLFLLTAPAAHVMGGFIPPVGLAPGSQYQLIFVTADALDALRPTIADYNAFVQHEASLSSSLPAGLTWKAVVSTLFVNANVNAPSGGYPVFNTDGNQFTGGTGIYSGNIHPPDLSNQYGTNVTGDGRTPAIFWTGSNSLGQAFNPIADGSNIEATFGVFQLEFGTTLVLNFTYGEQSQGTALDFLAISSPITVPTPEPATLSLLGSALLLIGGISLLRRQRAQSYCKNDQHRGN